MPEIKGFKGWRYNPSAIKDFTKVLAPPYDVISPKEQEALHKKNPSNVIRLILGKTLSSDNAKENRYTRARVYLRKWMDGGTLLRDDAPSIYIYAQDYPEVGRMKTRIGFMAAMKIDEKAVLKHENTLAAPKKDRMSLLKEVETNLSPIFGLFEDAKGSIQNVLKKSLSKKPVIDVRMDGVRHRIFLESDASRVKAISQLMRSKPMFIADGHHRFEVACQFRRWMKTQDPKATQDAGWNYVMTYFSDFKHNPFKIFPTHRLIRTGKKKDWKSLLQKKGNLAKVSGLKAVLSKLSKSREEVKDKRYVFGIYSKKEGFYLLTLDKSFSSKPLNPVDRLDVAALHREIIAPIFGIKTIEKSEAIDFTRNAEEACEKVKSGEFDLAFFLRPTSLGEMVLASKKGLKMPQKSTYFYPKLLSGLVFHKFCDGKSSQ